MGSVRRRHVWSRTQSRHSVQAAYPRKEWQPCLEELNGYIREARTRTFRPATSSSGEGLGDQLAKLEELHSSGALSDAEFEAAKARLLGT